MNSILDKISKNSRPMFTNHKRLYSRQIPSLSMFFTNNSFTYKTAPLLHAPIYTPYLLRFFGSTSTLLSHSTSEKTSETESDLERLKKELNEIPDDSDLPVTFLQREKDEIISRDTPPDCTVDDFESFGSMLFAFLGRLGKELKTGQINEILIRGSKYWLGGFRKGSLAVFMLFDLKYFGKVLPEFVNAPLTDIS